MKTLPYIFVGLSLLSMGTASWAADEGQRQSHFKGKPSATLEQAVTNFKAHNAKLAKLLAKDKLSPNDALEVHELTYTLENALEKIRGELSELADVLEEVHVASEKVDTATIKSRGKVYLDTAGKVIK
jgi:uncharacterized protein (DUF342 family)